MPKFKPILYSELKYWATVGVRSGRFWKLKKEQRAHFKACLLFAKHVRVIFSEVVVAQLRRAIELLMHPRIRALKVGREKAREMRIRFKHNGVFKWAPCLRSWLMDTSYQLYLGFMCLNEPLGYQHG